MYYDIVLTQLDEHNEISIILCKKYKPKILIIVYSILDKNKLELIKKIYKTNNINCTIKEIEIKKGDIESFNKIINDYSDHKLLVNLTEGERINALILLNICSKLEHINCIHIDLFEMKQYLLTSSDIIVTNEILEDIKINDITQLSGNTIINDSNYLLEKKDVLDLTRIIINNLEVWEHYKHILYDTKIFSHNYKDSSTVIVNTNYLIDDDIKLLTKILKYIASLGSINYTNKNETIEITFNNSYLKSFIFKSGTWLEVLTNNIVNEIKAVDESISGLEFVWSGDNNIVKNELDVVAIKDSVLICISCKDSDKYDENALNELDVYSNRLGGNRVIKILVASKYPSKKTIMERAKEMNINIIIVNKDLNRFKRELINVIVGT